MFLPGAGADPHFWQPVVNWLPGSWGMQRFAWPGLGHNEPSPDVNGFDDLVRLVERSLPGDEVTLVAHSLGGAVAMAVALRHRQKVRSLVLTATSAGLDVAKYGAEEWRPAYRAEYPQASPWLYEARPAFDTQLGQLLQPSLLLWGDNDPISPVAVGQHLRRVLPNATLHVIPGGTHDIPVDHAPTVASLIRAHVFTVSR